MSVCVNPDFLSLYSAPAATFTTAAHDQVARAAHKTHDPSVGGGH